MSKWGTKIDIPIFDNRINLSDLDNIKQYEYDCNKDKCLKYIYENGKTIFDETDKFVNLSDNIFSEKIKMIFNTNNSIKSKLLNDYFIDSIQKKMFKEFSGNIQIDKNYIINHILHIIKPYLLNNTEIEFISIKDDIINTLIFKIRYMKDIKSQLEFILNNETIEFIRKKVSKDINTNPKKEFIIKILRNEINKFTNRYNTTKNKMKVDNIKGIYYDKLSTLTEKNIFTIIYNTIAHIYSILKIEQNVKNNNEKLDKWTTILGDNNKHGIRQYSDIRVNNKKPPGMLFNMNY